MHVETAAHRDNWLASKFPYIIVSLIQAIFRGVTLDRWGFGEGGKTYSREGNVRVLCVCAATLLLLLYVYMNMEVVCAICSKVLGIIFFHLSVDVNI